MQQSTTNLKIAEVIDDGWLDGAPTSVSSDAVHADLMAYRKMVCPVCRKSGGKATPQHHCQTGAYRCLFSCRVCRHVEAC